MTPIASLHYAFFMSLHAGSPEHMILCFTCCLFTRKNQHLRTEFITGVVFFIELSCKSKAPFVLELLIFCAFKYAMPWNFPFSFSHMMSVFMNCVWVRASLNFPRFPLPRLRCDQYLQKSMQPPYCVGALWSKVESELLVRCPQATARICQASNT